MPQGFSWPIRLLVQSGQVEVCITQQRIERQRLAIRGHCFVFPLEVFKQCGEVERQDGARRARLAIHMLRLLEFSVEVEQSPEIDPRLEVILLNAQRGKIRSTRRVDVR